jgi:hypothetical protein
MAWANEASRAVALQDSNTAEYAATAMANKKESRAARRDLVKVKDKEIRIVNPLAQRNRRRVRANDSAAIKYKRNKAGGKR